MNGKICKYCDRYGGVDGEGWCSHWQSPVKELDGCDNFKPSRRIKPSAEVL